jgi:hypothetical protein
VFDIVPIVNNNHGSAIYVGFNGEVLEKNDLKLDTVPISATDHQSAIPAYSDRFPVLDNISLLIIHKESGRSTGFDRYGLTGKDNYHIDLI